jgi:hypothetical protein
MAQGTSGWGHRFWLARVLLDIAEPLAVTDGEFGRRVAKRMKRRKAYRTSSVSQWRTEKQIPPPDVQRAIALECGVDPGWLTYGADSAAPAPSIAETAEYKSRLAQVEDAMASPARARRDHKSEGDIQAARTRRTAGRRAG